MRKFENLKFDNKALKWINLAGSQGGQQLIRDCWDSDKYGKIYMYYC